MNELFLKTFPDLDSKEWKRGGKNLWCLRQKKETSLTGQVKLEIFSVIHSFL